MSHQLRCKNKAYKENNTAPALKHGGASVMFLLCFGASGTAGLEISRVSRHPGVKCSLQKAPFKPQTVEAVFS